MKWIGIIVILLGFVGFASLHGFESTLPLVQFVDGEAVVTNPIHIVLPKGTTFIKGSGENGAKFVDIHSDAAKYIGMARYLGLAKLGCLVLGVLGAVGFGFERWREKTFRDYQLSESSKIEEVKE